jgi:large repetitive protein
MTITTCKSQVEIDTLFNQWLRSVTITGGCNAVVTNNNTGAPSECSGSKTVTWTGSAGCANNVTCSATFTVLPFGPPVIDCPADITIACNTSTLPSNTGFPVATDACNNMPVLTYDDQINLGSCEGSYTISRTWTATDKCNNTSTCIQEITVQNTIIPTFTLPPDITIFKNSSAAGLKTLVNYNFNFGNSYKALSPIRYTGITSSVESSANSFAKANGTVTGNLAFATNAVAGKALTVVNSQVGNWIFHLSGMNLPLFSNFEVYLQAFRVGNGSAANILLDWSTDGVNYTNFNTTALSTGTWTQVYSTLAGVSNPANLYIRVRYNGGTGQDPKNLHIDNFQIRAAKPLELCAYDDAPSITGYPTNVNHPCDANPTSTYVDSLSAGVCVTKVYRTWTVTDDCGNSSTGSGKQVITVLDTIGPVITCPSGAALTNKADTTVCHYTVVDSKLDAIAVDACTGDSVTIKNNYNNAATLMGVKFPVGQHTIKWTATDLCGNTSTCQYVLTIFEIEPPKAKCKNDSIALDATGKYVITVDSINNGSTDNCGIKSMKLNRYDYGCDDIPSRPVILTVTDSTGLSDTCMSTLYIFDLTPPSITCKNISISLPPSKSKTIIPEDVLSLLKDNCGIATKVVSPNKFDCKSPKVTTVVVTVTDPSGNKSTCQATVTITNTSDADCDGVSDVCDVCPKGDDSVDNNNDGLPDCKYPPPFNKILAAWRCGTNPQKVWIAELGTGGVCTTKCVLFSDFLMNPSPNKFLGPCIECPGNIIIDEDGRVFVTGEVFDTISGLVKTAINPELVDFIIVPNPNYGVFDLVFDSKVNQGSLQVYNLLNQIVWTYEIRDEMNHIRINSNEFKQKASGMYRVVFKNNYGKTMQSLLILK